LKELAETLPSSPIPAMAVIAIPRPAEGANQVIDSFLLASFVLIDVDAPEEPNLSILQIALLIAGTLKS
jgi:hypothetical protein